MGVVVSGDHLAWQQLNLSAGCRRRQREKSAREGARERVFPVPLLPAFSVRLQVVTGSPLLQHLKQESKSPRQGHLDEFAEPVIEDEDDGRTRAAEDVGKRPVEEACGGGDRQGGTHMTRKRGRWTTLALPLVRVHVHVPERMHVHARLPHLSAPFRPLSRTGGRSG